MKHLSLISLPSVNGEAKTTAEIEKLHFRVLVHLAKRKLWKHAKNVMNFSYECSFILTNLKKIKLVYQKNVFFKLLRRPVESGKNHYLSFWICCEHCSLTQNRLYFVHQFVCSCSTHMAWLGQKWSRHLRSSTIVLFFDEVANFQSFFKVLLRFVSFESQ